MMVIEYFQRMATSFFRYLTFERYCLINQHPKLCNAFSILPNERRISLINISFYLDKIDKLFK